MTDTTKVRIDKSDKRLLDRIREERAPELDLSFRQTVAMLVSEEAERLGIDEE